MHTSRASFSFSAAIGGKQAWLPIKNTGLFDLLKISIALCTLIKVQLYNQKTKLMNYLNLPSFFSANFMSGFRGL